MERSGIRDLFAQNFPDYASLHPGYKVRSRRFQPKAFMPAAPPRSNAELGLKVLRSIHDAEVRYCVDILQQADGRLTYREFRRDPEDGGRWFITNDFSHRSFADEAALMEDAQNEIGWLRSFLS